MREQTIHPAIMLGGGGTRLWPLSRGDRPKQFLSLVGEGSLFQETARRLSGAPFGAPWLLTNAETLHHAMSQLDDQDLPTAGVVVEPLMRGTAAALAAVALVIGRDDPDALVLAAPSDHVVERGDRFRAAVQKAVPIATRGEIVTFGIVPTMPETGFGYIRPGAPIMVDGEPAAFAIGRGGFVEKPSRERAEAFIAEGCLWNAGIFLFKAAAFIAELERHAPQTFAAASDAVRLAAVRARNSWHLDPAAFSAAPAELSVDHAVMEKTDHAAVVPCEALGWSDVGSLSALWDIDPAKDARGNVLKGDVLAHETARSLVYARSGRKVVTAHVEDLVVVDTDDCVVVLPRDHAQSVRAVVAELRGSGAAEVNSTRDAVFDWGRITLCDRAETHFCVRVDLRQGAVLEPRLVRQPIESWTVVSGALTVTRRDDVAVVPAGAAFGLAAGETVAMTCLDSAVTAIVVFAGAPMAPLGDLLSPARLRESLTGLTVGDRTLTDPAGSPRLRAAGR